MEQRKQGCLAGLFELFLLNKVFDWLQRKFGYKSGSCIGCGCGVVLVIIFIMIAISIIFGTDWFRLF
jgi:predicted PurR-regulated permease PerM